MRLSISALYLRIRLYSSKMPKTDERVTAVNHFEHEKNILYLMRRDKRIFDNHCVELGFKLSYKSKTKFYTGVEFSKLKINERQKTFVIEGLQEMEEACREHNIYFDLIDNLEKFVEKRDIDCIIMDFSPLRECEAYRNEVEEMCSDKELSLYVVDAHNMVPCKLLDVYKRTSKAVKIQLFNHWDDYLSDFKPLEKHLYNKKSETSTQSNDFPKKSVKNIFKGGYSHGMDTVEHFFDKKFAIYAKNRNNPDVDALSNLSPWISSGQISSQKVIYLATKRFGKKNENYISFINEIFAVKENSEHFCLHEKNYDNIDGALQWAKDSLNLHRNDKRERIYDLETLEMGKTKDQAWNAAQRQLLAEGKLHGYCRMYWAKQLLKWTKTPEEAIKTACYLNDTFAIDGNCPNGFLGPMWSICGSMDQGFKERPVTGKIRPMNAFKAPLYISKWSNYSPSSSKSSSTSSSSKK
ncbi:deoxyribodipyrimidine photo-lyase [Galendromus occidentalis]|uniref:Deoxyribodipyrimidine photo-lyase n=1 Tax=Galendromus occidentalis TaxID=34638 RepID=A0AAJ7WGV1_9ACAR|nr:deoxyribodipyrimidine photo-lyase [Galendromus occidentalis]